MIKYTIDYNRNNSVSHGEQSYHTTVCRGDIIADEYGCYFKVLHVIHGYQTCPHLIVTDDYENKY